MERKFIVSFHKGVVLKFHLKCVFIGFFKATIVMVMEGRKGPQCWFLPSEPGLLGADRFSVICPS